MGISKQLSVFSSFEMVKYARAQTVPLPPSVPVPCKSRRQSVPKVEHCPRKNTSSTMKIESTMKPIHIRPSLITTVTSPLQEDETQSPEDFAYELLEELEEVCDTRTSEEKLSIIEDYLSDLSEDFKGSPQSEVDRFAIILMHDSMSLFTAEELGSSSPQGLFVDKLTGTIEAAMEKLTQQ